MKRIVTHSGRFHVDELFALATAKIALGEEIEVVRTRDPRVIASGDYCIDVGGEYDPSRGRFDHHQEGGAGKRQNGILFSSFALLWKSFGAQAIQNVAARKGVSLSEEDVSRIWTIIDERMVAPIDAHDVGMETVEPVFDGVYPYLAHSVFSAFLPTWLDEESPDDAFPQAQEVAEKVLRGEIWYLISEKVAEKEVLAAYEKSSDKHIIVLEKNLPWEGVLGQKQEPLFVITPDQTPGLWKAKAVRDDMHSFKNRKDFPKTWAGKSGEELQALSGVSDAVFCHNARFIAVARSEEGATALARIALAEHS